MDSSGARRRACAQRTQRRAGDGHRFGQVVGIPHAGAQRPAGRTIGPGAVPRSDQGAGERPAPRGSCAQSDRGARRYLRWRHACLRARLGSGSRDVRTDQSRHVESRCVALPPAVVGLPAGSSICRGRRVPWLPGRVRLPHRARAAAVATGGCSVRVDARVRPGVGDRLRPRPFGRPSYRARC